MIKKRVKVILVWTYFGIIPYLVFLSYYIAKAGNLDYWESYTLILVLLGYLLLHYYMVTQFVEVINNEQVGQGSGL